jgi:hypothetical protein
MGAKKMSNLLQWYIWLEKNNTCVICRAIILKMRKKFILNKLEVNVLLIMFTQDFFFHFSWEKKKETFPVVSVNTSFFFFVWIKIFTVGVICTGVKGSVVIDGSGITYCHVFNPASI